MRNKFRLIPVLAFGALLAACGGGAEPTEFLEPPTPPPTRPLLETPTGIATSTPQSGTAAGDAASYWVETEDPRTGVRFAVPCFWQVNAPTLEQDPSGLGAFPIQNYGEEFLADQGDKGEDFIWQLGAVKIDIAYLPGGAWGLPPGSSLNDLLNALPVNEELEQRDRVDEVRVNGQPALLVTTRNLMQGGTVQWYLLQVNEEVFMSFSVQPPVALYSDDVQGILHSFAMGPEVRVTLPDTYPSSPPPGVPAGCLDGVELPPPSEPFYWMACPVFAYAPENLACAIQAALLARNLPALQDLMTDPFTIGDWGSEGRSAMAAEALQELGDLRLPPDTTGLRFTTDRALFPGLEGTPPEQLLGEGVNVVLVVYSEGWGPEGQGAALLYFTENPNRTFSWYGLVYAEGGF